LTTPPQSVDDVAGDVDTVRCVYRYTGRVHCEQTVRLSGCAVFTGTRVGFNVSKQSGSVVFTGYRYTGRVHCVGYTVSKQSGSVVFTGYRYTGRVHCEQTVRFRCVYRIQVHGSGTLRANSQVALCLQVHGSGTLRANRQVALCLQVHGSGTLRANRQVALCLQVHGSGTL
jgi:hypothetical protein